MAEEKKQEKKKEEKKESKERIVSLIRIVSTDIPGNKKICFGLTRIKGVSFSFAAALCHVLKMDPARTISSLSEDEIKKITDFVNDPKIPSFLMNRRKDMETGQDKHLIGVNLDFAKEFDIKRLKKIRSYKGWRHALGLPVRGQRTKAHFRKSGKNKAVGVMKSKPKPSKGVKKK